MQDFQLLYSHRKSLNVMYVTKLHDLTITEELSPPTLTWNQNIPPPQSVGWVIEHVLGPNKGNVIIAGDYFHQRIRLIIFTVMASVELLSAFHLACYHLKSDGRILPDIPSKINGIWKLVWGDTIRLVLLMKCPLSWVNNGGMIWF